MKTENKEILINNDSRWMDIQSTFSVYYPFLKIVFIENDSSARGNKRSEPDNQLCIKNLTNVNEECKIDVNANRSVSQVSLDFKNILGLKVEILRKSGNVWNLISLTDGWTLENQNAAGDFICSQMAKPL